MIHFDIPALEKEKAHYDEKMNVDGFWNDAKSALKIVNIANQIKEKLDEYHRLFERIQSTEDVFLLLKEEKDEELQESISAEVLQLEKDIKKFETIILLSGPYDNNNAIIELHPGAGGTESQDWADMLFRMYKMYCEKSDFSMTVLDVLAGDEAGLKSITFEVCGENAYGFLKAEKGVHRLVRISPFDANARRHTSFASVEVMPKIEEKPNIELKAEDLKVDTYHSSGAGGQNVNKTESAVRITHIPTGIVVSCQVERSQVQNRERAMQMLYSKLAEKEEREELERLANIRGEVKKIEWGSQIRSYVFCPYTLVKDHRTGYENTNINYVMDGNIQEFINEYLKKI